MTMENEEKRVGITVDQALTHCMALERDYAERDDMLAEIDKMYFLDWEDKPDDADQQYKFTTSPSARNALLGAIRLMTSTEPKFNVPYEVNQKDAKNQSEIIERLCQAIWYHSGRFRGVPLEQPAVDSLLRYGMMVLCVTKTEDLKKIAEDIGASKAHKKQIDRLVKSTPFLIEAWDPKSVYPEWGRYGLTAVYRKTKMRLAEVKQQFGDQAVAKLADNDLYSDNDLVTYADYWDLSRHMAWISYGEGEEMMLAGDPIVDAEHKLPRIPIVVQTSEGSYMDVKREHQATPFLYGVLKSGLWERQNLELTIMYTNLLAIGANPTFVHETTGGEDAVFDYSIPGGRVLLQPGDKYYQLQKEVITNDMAQGLDIATGLIEQSTIFSQSLGQPLGANAAFSMVSLLHQAGRLPLAGPQKRGGWGMGDALEIVIEMIVDDDGVSKIKQPEGGWLELDVKQIPDDLIIDAILDIDLPQDMMAQVNTAQMAVQSGLISRRWAREKLLGIGQSDLMDKEIWNDQSSEAVYQELTQQMLQQMMRAQQKPPQGMPEGMPPGGLPPSASPPEQGGPRMAGSAMNTQEGLIPAQRPGQQPVPPGMDSMEMQEGEI